MIINIIFIFVFRCCNRSSETCGSTRSFWPSWTMTKSKTCSAKCERSRSGGGNLGTRRRPLRSPVNPDPVIVYVRASVKIVMNQFVPNPLTIPNSIQYYIPILPNEIYWTSLRGLYPSFFPHVKCCQALLVINLVRLVITVDLKEIRRITNNQQK
jgi:hypothetical protein